MPRKISNSKSRSNYYRNNSQNSHRNSNVFGRRRGKTNGRHGRNYNQASICKLNMNKTKHILSFFLFLK